MKNMKGTIWRLFLATGLLVSSVALATNHMTDGQKSALESAGVPVYPGATYLTGDENDGVSLWFLSADTPDTIMDWYAENLPDWAVTTINGVRVVYKGSAEIGLEELQNVPYVFVTSGEQLGRGGDYGNEITISIPASP